MKFWRIFAAAAVVGMLLPTAPALADDDDDDDDNGRKCVKETLKAEACDLTQCDDFRSATNTFVGNQFPWENSAFFFSSFRNQYLFPSANTPGSFSACTVNSIASRAVSFTGSSTNVYTGEISVRTGLSPLVADMNLNDDGTLLCQITGDSANPIIIGTNPQCDGGALVSDCLSCPGADTCERNMWCDLGAPPSTDILVDAKLFLAAGQAGGTIWDTDDNTFGTGCAPGGSRAFGSGSFANAQHLTTALGIDSFDFVWVYKGLVPPPPATVEQQIKEIIRLLLTPQGLRCSGLDRNPGNGVIEDDPVKWGEGASIDPISPQISTCGETTGDEAVDDLRKAGFMP